MFKMIMMFDLKIRLSCAALLFAAYTFFGSACGKSGTDTQISPPPDTGTETGTQTPPVDTSTKTPPADTGVHRDGSDFILWQLPIQNNTIGNSYVFLINDGKVVVMDGGWEDDADYLRKFLKKLGGTVDAWFISHPHPDHMGALNAIINDPRGITIHTIYYSRLSEDFIKKLPDNSIYLKYYNSLDVAAYLGTRVVNFTEPGKIITIGSTHFKILSVRNPEITDNLVNNSSMAIRVWDDKKSIVFLGDLELSGGKKLLAGPYKNDLNCDYLQMSHHGNDDVGHHFYKSITFSASLWPTPSWLWNNDKGKGYNTGPYSTVYLRQLVTDTLGITQNYVSWEGVSKIE